MRASAEPSLSAGSEVDPVFDRMVEEVVERLQAGRAIDLDDYAGESPERVERLRLLLPALVLMAEFGRSAVPDRARLGPVPGPGVLGDYRIVRELGRGGMGVVYEAEQVSLGRRVALKVMPFAAAMDPQQLARFKVEAQAAAQLHHTHIVPVYSVGCDQGVHYYAMQFIEGRTLAAVIQELRQARAAQAKPAADASPGLGSGPAGPRPAPSEETSTLDLRAAAPQSEASSVPDTATGPSQRGRAFYQMAAQLGIQAAEALEHAHRLGVLHRDIKPANLMVDTQGALWVTDFGLARFQDDPGLTRTGDLLGTLRYMSPEQALGRRVLIDERTDVYSLGATLYELLTLRPAFDGRDRHEVLHQVAHQEPIPPRKLNPSIPRDLETIVLKAMSKEVAGRYATAKDLADDLHRFLEDKPIHARRPTPLEHAAKWARRHQAAVLAAAAALVLTMAVAAALLWREQRKTADALHRLQEIHEKQRADLPLILQMAEATLLDAMAKVTASGGPGVEAGKKEFYRQASDLFEGIIRLTGGSDQTAMQEVEARAYFAAGLARMLGGAPGAEDAYRRSIDLYTALAAKSPGKPDYLESMVWPLTYLAKQALWTRGLAAAEPSYRRLLEVERKLVADYPRDADNRAQLVRGLVEWGGALMSGDRRREAEQVFREAVELDPDDTSVLNGLAWLLANRADASPRDLERALDLARKAVKKVPKQGEFWNTLGVAYYRTGDWKSAAEAIEKSMALRNGGDAGDWFVLAMIRWRQGDQAEARKQYDRGVAWMKQRAKEHGLIDPDLPRLQAEAKALLGESPTSPSRPNERGRSEPQPPAAGGPRPAGPPTVAGP
jgi:eukaryotic-like serine/threonine-protein kinase